MLILGASDSLSVTLVSAVTVLPVVVVVSYRDLDGATFSPGKNIINKTTSGDTVVVPPPVSGHRIVDFIGVTNFDSTNASVYLKINTWAIRACSLGPSESLEYADGSGFRCLTASGALKTVDSYTPVPVSTGLSVSVLASDVANASAVANTLQDVTGLSFAVANGQRYRFRFVIDYTSTATTTGSRWTISGPAVTRLTYRSSYGLTATSETVNHLTAYDSPAASNASSPSTAGNIAIIEGIVVPSASGTVTARFASEVASSAITAKAGSYVEYQPI